MTGTSQTAAFPIVGLGASAGGLEALETFLSALPPAPGMAFVVVTHLHAGRPSLLPQILARHTKLPVSVVDGPTRVESDHIYFGPPGILLDIVDGVLSSSPQRDGNTAKLPIDHFFRALATDQMDRAIGVILSGTGSDGTLGLKEIKGGGGIVMAQSEASARYSGMPRSAIATDLVDFVLPADQLALALLDFGAIVTKPLVRADDDALPEDLHRVFLLLRQRTGHDFSCYKPNTIRRRIERRMIVHRVDTLKAYLRLLQASPEERDILVRELLIGVTSFFRDPGAFETLAEAIPSLFTGDPDKQSLRAWVPACSTGEEAYSIAILLHEQASRAEWPLTCQVFATDIDARAIDVARTGVYPDSIAADVTPERLARYFVGEGDTFRLRKEIRDMIIFAPQNLVGDPPFTRLDLVSCRNLLIYLNADMQARLVTMFHYALGPGSLLFLGSSESAGETPLFATTDKRAKLFRRVDGASPFVADFPVRRSRVAPATESDNDSRRAEMQAGFQNSSQAAARVLLQQLVPPTVIVREHGEIVYIHGRTGRYLEPAPGSQISRNIVDMAREGLQLDLASALRQASQAADETDVVRRNVRIQTDGDIVAVDLRVRKLTNPEGFRGLYLISFEGTRLLESPDDEHAVISESQAPMRTILELERQLQDAKELNRGTVEELETTNEELKAANEELQSTNEELQSTNEELETSKEELQSLNEELQTVNTELQLKLDQLATVNDDMRNLLNGTEIATLFLDHELNIKRFTEQARRVMRLIPGDVGRPIGDIRSTLVDDRIATQARQVLDTLVVQIAEVRSQDGKWYLMRILPYRTTENVIDGVVITFVDISNIKGLQDEASRFVRALERSPTTVFGQDRSLRFRWACSSVFGHPPEDVIGKTEQDLLPAAEADKVIALKQKVLETGQPMRALLQLQVDGNEALYDLYLEPGRDGEGQLSGVTGVVTELRGSGATAGAA